MAQKRCFGCMQLKNNTVCEHCGYDENSRNAVHQLPAGTVLKGQYEVGKVLGQGGFGITYLGWDQYLEIPVAIKEYYPTGMVMRESRHSLAVTNCEGENGELFEYNRKRFLKEAQSLAKLSDIPQVVKVMGFFPENGTAYIIMEYVQGITLKDYILKQGPLSGKQALNIFRPVMEGMQQVHAAGLVHRDISPDNIMLLPSGNVKLLDFGAVRDYGNKNASQSTQAILKPGFAPLEQYKSKGELGPWTDVYALSATIYYCMTGKLPPDAPERMLEGTEPDWSLLRGFTQSQIDALKRGMALRREDRIPTAGYLLSQLVYGDSRQDSPQFPKTEPVKAAAYTAPVDSPSYTVPLEPENPPYSYVPKTAPVDRTSYTAPVEPTPFTAPVDRTAYTAPVEPESEPYRYAPLKEKKKAPKKEAPKAPPRPEPAKAQPRREMPQVPKEVPKEVPQEPVKKSKGKKKKLALIPVLFLTLGLVFYLVNLGKFIVEQRENRARFAAAQAQSETAVTVAGEEVSGTVVNYYFVDMVNHLASGELKTYEQMGMLDPAKALDQQTNPLTGETWSQTVMDRVLDQMQFNYAVAGAAKAAGYTSDAVAQQVRSTEESLDLLAKSYGYESANAYLRATYGEGASWQTYASYLERCYLAEAYYNDYLAALVLTDTDRRALETEMNFQFHSYTYNYYFVSAKLFDGQGQSPIDLAEKTAKALIGAGVTSPETMDAAIVAQGLYDGSSTVPTSTQCTNVLGKDIAQAEIRQWISEKARYAGEKAAVPKLAADGAVEGYYAVLLRGVTDNRMAMRNVRHILVSAQTPNAKEEAMNILDQWRVGAATQDSFAQLADELSHDKSSVGGLYIDVYPGQMVAAFDRWVFDAKRYAGETGIVQTEYGFHVMYFVGNSSQIYRNWLIDRELYNRTVNQWITGLREGMKVTVVDLSQVKTGLILNPQ